MRIVLHSVGKNAIDCVVKILYIIMIKLVFEHFRTPFKHNEVSRDINRFSLTFISLFPANFVRRFMRDLFKPGALLAEFYCFYHLQR